MPDLSTLAAIVTSANDALDAEERGDQARKEAAYEMAFKQIDALQVAAQTRETIQRTTQSKDLFAGKLELQGQDVAQAGLTTRQSGVETRGAERAEKTELDVAAEIRRLLAAGGTSPEEDAALLSIAQSREALQKAKAGTAVSKTALAEETKFQDLEGPQATATGRVAEAGARPVVAGAVQEKAELDTMSARYQRFFGIPKISAETLAKTLPQEYGFKLATLEARKAEVLASTQKTELQTRELEFKLAQQKVLEEGFKQAGLSPAESALWTWAIDNGFAPDASHYESQIDMLTMALARIETAPSIKAAIEEAAATQEAAGVSGSAQRGVDALSKLKNLWGETERPFTTEENKNAARTLLRNQINALEVAKSRLPLAREANLLKEEAPYTPKQVRERANQLRQAGK